MFQKDVDNKIRNNIKTIYKQLEKMQFRYLETLVSEQDSYKDLKNTQKLGKAMHGKNILLVEDEEIVSELIFKALHNRGFKLFQCENGQIALNEFQAHKRSIDICLVDYELPDMNGFKLVEQILSIKDNTNIIFMSGHSDIELLLKNSIQKFPLIKKPFKLKYLVEQIEKVLNQCG